MSKRYKLRKDLPGYKAGTIFEAEQTIFFGISGKWRTENDNAGLTHTKSVTNICQYPDWFEELPPEPTRWRAEKGGDYFIVKEEAGVNQYTEERDSIDDGLHELGNYFQTKQTAEKVAEAVKALYAYVHAEDAADRDVYVNLVEASSAAQRAVQSDNQLHKEG